MTFVGMILGPTDPPEHIGLYAIPGILFAGGYLAAASQGMGSLVEAGYLTSSILCISASSPLSSSVLPLPES